jgi:hypothetical protein
MALVLSRGNRFGMLWGMPTSPSIQGPDLVNPPTIARRVVEEGLAPHMSRQRVVQLANDPDSGFPPAVLTAGRSKLYPWSTVRAFFAERDTRPIRRDRRSPQSGRHDPSR